MDHNEELQEEEFDLESILSEFHDPAGDEPIPEPDPDPIMPDLSGIDAALEGLSDETQIHMPPIPPADTPTEPDITAETLRFVSPALEVPELEEDAEPEASDPLPEPEEAPGEDPLEETFIPAPAVFTPKSRLKELKKKLVAGPEKQYYVLSEQGTGKLQVAVLLNLVITVLCGGSAAMFQFGGIPDNRLKLIVFAQVLGMLFSALLGSGLIIDAVADLFTKGRFTVNTLLILTLAACSADAVFCLEEERIPCCAAFSLAMTMALWSRYQRRTTELSELDTMRKAVRLHGLVKTEAYYEGMPGLQQVEGEVEDFMDTYQKPSAPEKLQSVYAVIALLVCLGIAALAYLNHGTSMAVQVLSTSLLAAVPATFFISITRPKAILERRLHMVGSVLCGWKGVKALSGKAAFPIRDQDLFPQGSTKLNGVKFYNGFDPDTVVSLSTSLLVASGSALEPVFQQLLKNRGGTLHSVQSLRTYPGGISGVVCGRAVLLGNQGFLQDMDIEIPEGTMVNQAVYAALDGKLAAVYAISYAKMRSAAAGLVTLCGYRRLTPLVLCSDFMLTESFLRAKFELKSKRLAFPAREDREELFAKQPGADAQVLALITREELVSAAYAVTGARALRTSTNLGLVIHLIGGVLGLLIMLVLAFLGSTELLTPVNLLLYQLIWAVPGLLVTEWTRTV